jgi:hypothetical protein
MIAFNAWYYSFSPTIAAIIREHSTVRDAAKLVLYPLIGILRIGGATYHLLPTDQEASTVITGVVVSSLIGSVYLSLPLAVLFRYSARARRLGRKLTVPLSCALLLALITTALTLTVDAPLLPMMIAPSAIVLTSLAVSTLIASIAIARLLAVVQHALTAARLAGIP